MLRVRAAVNARCKLSVESAMPVGSAPNPSTTDTTPRGSTGTGGVSVFLHADAHVDADIVVIARVLDEGTVGAFIEPTAVTIITGMMIAAMLSRWQGDL